MAVGVQLKAQRMSVEKLRKDGQRQTGETKVAEVVVQSVRLDNSDSDVGPTLMVACRDVGEVDVLDENGKSV